MDDLSNTELTLDRVIGTERPEIFDYDGPRRARARRLAREARHESWHGAPPTPPAPAPKRSSVLFW